MPTDMATIKKNGSGCPLPSDLPGRLHHGGGGRAYQLMPAPAEKLVSPPDDAPVKDTLPLLPTMRW